MKGDWKEQYGQMAYNAYWDDAKGFTFDGRTMPRWDELGDAVRAHWICAASTVALSAVKHGTLPPLERPSQ